MRIFLSTVGLIAALVLCAVSAAMNYLFLSSFGKSPLEGQVLGAASAAADVLKALLPFFIAWSWQARRFIAAASGSLAFVFFAGFSLLSAIGFAADNRGTLVQQRNDLTSAYARVHDMQAYADARLKALPTHRAVTIVREEIEQHRQHPRWTSTKGCTDATETVSREYCAGYFKLRAEAAAAQEAERFVGESEALDKELVQLRSEGAGHANDPQVSLLSRMFGLGEDTVRMTLIVAVAMLVEIGASLGLFLASGHGIAEQKAAEPDAELPAGLVDDFVLEALAPSSGALSPDAVTNAYEAWCRARGNRPLPSAAFAASFRDLAQQAGIESRDGAFQRISITGIPLKRAA